MRDLKRLRLAALASGFGTVVALALESGSKPIASLFALGFVSFLTGVSVFLIDGGARITPAGVLFLSTSVFLGGSMLYLAELGSRSATSTVLLAGALSHGAILGTIVLYSRLVKPDDAETAHTLGPWKPSVPRRSNLVVLAAALVALALVLGEVDTLGALGTAAGFAGLALFTATLATTRPRSVGGLGILGKVLPLLLVLLYLSRSFSGSGRLVVTGLLLMVVYAVSVSWGSRILKPAVVVALIPGLVWAGTFNDTPAGSSTPTSSEILSDGAGLGSMYGPLDSLAEIRERELDPSREDVPRQYGATFWASAVVWVPRDLWPAKPLGWGAVLAETLSPEYRDGIGGHSDMALVVGEFYANFGAVGLLLLPIALAAFLAFLRRAQSRVLMCMELSQRQTVRWAALLACVASLSDLFWGGTFSWAARGGMAAGLLLILSSMFRNDVPVSDNSELLASARRQRDAA